MSDVPKIHAALVAVMKRIGAVPKGSRNKEQGYEYRSAEDLVAALQPALIEAGVSMLTEVEDLALSEYETKKGTRMSHAVVRVGYQLRADDGSSVRLVVHGEGADSGDKAINKAYTSALKTAIGQAFMVPTEMRDAEGDSPEPPAERPSLSDTSPATESDLGRISDAIEARCADGNLDPEVYGPIIMADVLAGTAWTWETVPDIPRKDVGWICSSISTWVEKDSAPGFAQPEDPPPAAPEPEKPRGRKQEAPPDTGDDIPF